MIEIVSVCLAADSGVSPWEAEGLFGLCVNLIKTISRPLLGHQLAAACLIEMASIDATPKVTNVTRKLITIN